MELRQYQKDDVAKLKQFNSIACFNEQRTGKTPTALAILKEKGCKRNLIICPASATYQWIEEYERWMGEPCITLYKTKTKEEVLDKIWTHGLVVSYGLFKDTAKHLGIADYVADNLPDAVILDEAHRIKEPKTAAAKAAFKIIKTPVKIALTGTPAPNKPHEVFSILHWLFPDRFKSYWKFIDEYFQKDLKHGFGGRNYIEIGGFKTLKDVELQRFLDKFSTQRKRKEVMQWLPNKDYQQIKLPCTRDQIRYLEQLRLFYETEHIVTKGTLDRLVRYRQICLHPKLINLKGESPKLEWLKSWLEEHPDTPTIIFSKFTSFLKIAAEELPEKKGLIVGETPIETRNELKQDFQNGKLNLLLINIDAGKEALTLDKAEVAIFCDKYPPVGDIAQAEDRFVSTTEDRANKPHLIIELMMKGTYDERLYDLIAQRKDATDIINDYKKYMKGVTTA